MFFRSADLDSTFGRNFIDHRVQDIEQAGERDPGCNALTLSCQKSGKTSTLEDKSMSKPA